MLSTVHDAPARVYETARATDATEALPDICCRCLAGKAAERRHRERERRVRAAEATGLSLSELEGRLSRAAYGGLRRAVLRDENENPSDAEVARHWVAAVELVVPRSVPWPSSPRHIEHAHDCLWRELAGEWAEVAKRINTRAAGLWAVGGAR